MEEKLEIRDLRRKQFFQVDDAYLNGYAKLCGVYATGVYLSLCRHSDKRQQSFPSVELIAQEHSMGKRTVLRAIKSLEDYNIVKRMKTRSKNGKWLNNIYILVDKTRWKPKPNASRASGEPVDNSLSQMPENTKPSAAEDISQASDRHLKETHEKDTHLKELKEKEKKEKLSTDRSNLIEKLSMPQSVVKDGYLAGGRHPIIS